MTYGCLYSPSKGTIASVILRNLDVNFQEQTFSHGNFDKKLVKNWNHYNCNQIGRQLVAIEVTLLRMLYIMTFTYNFKVTHI